MRMLGIPGPVVRLSVLFVVALIVLVAVRARFVPESFGELGHYRADVVPVLASLPVRYAGMAACVECHEDEGERKSRSYHRGLTCEGCHEAAADHAGDPTEHPPAVPAGRAGCLRCHSYLMSRPTGFPQVVEKLHNPMEPCAGCHDPHDPTPPATSGEPGECFACHTAIARTKAVSHHWSLDCTTCHAAPDEHLERPRAHLPKKPASRGFCGGCHAKDADSLPGIPRIDLNDHWARYLCWQCHYPHDPEGR